MAELTVRIRSSEIQRDTDELVQKSPGCSIGRRPGELEVLLGRRTTGISA